MGYKVELYNDRGTLVVGAKLSDNIMPGVVSIYEGAWPQIDSKGRCNNGLVNFITSSRRSSGLTQATTANTCLAYLRKCTDRDPGGSRAFEPRRSWPMRRSVSTTSSTAWTAPPRCAKRRPRR